MKIPKNLKHIFWDTNIQNIDKEKHKQYIIDRVLEYADFDGDKWIEGIYTKSEIVECIKDSKTISIKTANMYSLIYNIPQEEILCFQQPFTQKQERF